MVVVRPDDKLMRQIFSALRPCLPYKGSMPIGEVRLASRNRPRIETSICPANGCCLLEGLPAGGLLEDLAQQLRAPVWAPCRQRVRVFRLLQCSAQQSWGPFNIFESCCAAGPRRGRVLPD